MFAQIFGIRCYVTDGAFLSEANRTLASINDQEKVTPLLLLNII
jgi:hypothetical protein